MPSRPLIISPDTLRDGGSAISRTPPGQVLTKKWPVLHAGKVPKVDPHDGTWSLRIFGQVEKPYTLSYDDFLSLPAVDVKCDMHCVTRWSRLDNLFTGVQTKLLIEKAQPNPGARFIMCHSENGWTTNLPLSEFIQEDCVLATHWEGEPLSPDHGFPVRGIIPRLYLWKSAKWIRAIEVRTTDAPGFWEQGGYHMHGDPWAEERYGW